MEKPKKKNINTSVTVAVLILIAYLCRIIGSLGIWSWQLGLLRSFLYIALFSAWGVTMYNRILHPQVRQCMAVIACLMMSWFVFRTIKFQCSDSLPVVSRYMWYLYYLPMLLIPLFALFVAFSIGIPENKPLPKKTLFLWIPAAFLLLLVLTNDLHQLVFTFPADAAVWTDSDYGYSIGYVLVIVFLLFCALTILTTLSLKCRLPGNRRRVLLPCIPILILLLYMLLNFLRVSWLYVIAGDMTAVFCLMYAATLELCIRQGLIQTNTGYAELFQVSRLGAQITDTENTVCLASANAMPLTGEQRQSAENAPVAADKNTLVKSHAIRFGHVLWQEDIRELAEAIEQIEENCRNLEERNRIQRENLEIRKKVLALQEKNRASDLLHRETAPQISRIDRMLAQVDQETDEAERRRLLAGVAVLGAFIKRYGNLLLMGERTQTADIHDLGRCFEESLINLELLGVKGLQNLPAGVSLSTKEMLRIYHHFETIVEACLYDLKFVWIKGRDSGACLLLSLEFVCDSDLSAFASGADGFFQEDDSTRFTYQIPKGGEQQ